MLCFKLEMETHILNSHVLNFDAHIRNIRLLLTIDHDQLVLFMSICCEYLGIVKFLQRGNGKAVYWWNR